MISMLETVQFNPPSNFYRAACNADAV